MEIVVNCKHFSANRRKHGSGCIKVQYDKSVQKISIIRKKKERRKKKQEEQKKKKLSVINGKKKKYILILFKKCLPISYNDGPVVAGASGSPTINIRIPFTVIPFT